MVGEDFPVCCYRVTYTQALAIREPCETKLQFVTEALDEGGRHLHLSREEILLFFQPQHQL